MADKSKIEWTDSTWNPITGCSKVSQGCKFCYAERWAIRGMGQWAKDRKRKFTDILFHPDKLTDPIKWKKPRMIFVCSMADLFHPDIPFETIELIFDVMYKAEQHIFQVLTKRPERMLEFYKWYESQYTGWKQKNIWLGVSVEDQKTADERIPILVSIPAYVRFISIEPLLGAIDKIVHWDDDDEIAIDWIIVGGESGPKARLVNPDWVRSLRDICVAGGIPFFFKQWGEWMPIERYKKKCVMIKVGKKRAGRLLDGKQWDQMPSLAKEHFDDYSS